MADQGWVHSGRGRHLWSILGRYIGVSLGWLPGVTEAKYLPLQDDIASVAFWYQMLPTAPFPKLPGPDYLEIG